MKTEFMPPPSNWATMPIHPLAELVGIGKPTSDAMQNFMGEHGYDEQESLIVYEQDGVDMLLDGRLRRGVCIALGITPTFRRFIGKNPAAYVAKKAHRQHLDSSQRAMVAAAISKKTKITQAEAASTLNVSPRSVFDAVTVQETGVDELQEAVGRGEVSVSDAAKVARQEPETQREAVQKVRNGHAKTASKAVEPEITDDAGKAVPKELEDIFASVDAFKRAANLAQRAAAAWAELEATPAFRLLDSLQKRGAKIMYSSHFRSAQTLAEAWKPTFPCVCGGLISSCPECMGKGFLLAEDLPAKEGAA